MLMYLPLCRRQWVPWVTVDGKHLGDKNPVDIYLRKSSRLLWAVDPLSDVRSSENFHLDRSFALDIDRVKNIFVDVLWFQRRCRRVRATPLNEHSSCAGVRDAGSSEPCTVSGVRDAGSRMGLRLLQ